jgi:ribosomal protein L11 methyltransferase
VKYTEVTIHFPAGQQLLESLMALLLDVGYDSFMETEHGIVAYIESGLFEKQTLDNAIKTCKGKPLVEKISELPDQNWNALWESNYEPVVVDEKCIVRAPFHDKPAKIQYDVLIQPKMSFGTAHHATTYLMIQMMLGSDLRGKKVLDMGAGTGVLAILASLKGALQVAAIDNDEWAYNNAIENCELNGTKNINVIFGDASAIPEAEFGVLLANINRNILLEDIRLYNRHLAKGAMAMLSGFYKHDLKAIVEEAEKFGWNLTEFRERDDWVAAKFLIRSSEP